MSLPPPPGYYQEDRGRMVHHPGFGETAQNYPGLPGLRILVIATALLVAIVGVLLYFPRGPSPDEWASQLARAAVADAVRPYLGENQPSYIRFKTTVIRWSERSGCKISNSGTAYAESRTAVRERLAVEMPQPSPGHGFGYGTAIIPYKSPLFGGKFAGLAIVADCTKEQQIPMRGPFG